MGSQETFSASQNPETIAVVKELYANNMNHASILQALNEFHGISITSDQLNDLRLHPSTRLLMGPSKL